MNYFISFIVSFLFGAATLVIGVQNPIHSILILIIVFFLGSVLLFLLCMEYFALLFLIVYVGAIVVLFLFIVMMLEIKIINTSERFKDLFSFRNIILAFLVLEVLFFSSEEVWDLSFLFNTDISISTILSEVNLYTDYSKLLYQPGQLRALGGVLFTDYILSIILISILLFISMFGSIVMTLETHAYKIIKEQDSNIQGLRHPNMTSLSYRFDTQDKKITSTVSKEKDYALIMHC
jgi:NADH-quinone oxidoreductase subunit J